MLAVYKLNLHGGQNPGQIVAKITQTCPSCELDSLDNVGTNLGGM